MAAFEAVAYLLLNLRAEDDITANAIALFAGHR
jgi:hypothetical protein